MLRLASVLMALYSYFLVQTNIGKLPRCIPTHFDAAGKANGWGSPDTLWVLLFAQVLVGLVFLAVPYLGERFPGIVNLGRHRLSDYSPEQQARILPLLQDMAGYMSLLTNLFFVLMLRQVIHAATDPAPHLNMAPPMTILLGGFLVVMLYYMRKIFRITKETVARQAAGLRQS